MTPTCPNCGSEHVDAVDIEHPIYQRKVDMDTIVETWECMEGCGTWTRRYNLHHEEETT